MEKINVVLVVLNVKYLQRVLEHLNPARANLVAVVVDGYGKNSLQFGGKEVPVIPFAYIQQTIDEHKNCIWLIRGVLANGLTAGNIYAMKKFLVMSGVPEDNIVNFTMMISRDWLANLNYIKNNGADFFATGISYSQKALDLKSIPHVRGRAVSLAGTNQDLRQGYFTAKRIFEHFKTNPPPTRVKFVLIGLVPYLFRYDNAKSFAVCPRNLQYMIALDRPESGIHDHLLKILVSDRVNAILKNTSTKFMDLNYSNDKRNSSYKMPGQCIISWERTLASAVKKFVSSTVEENTQIIQDYIELCLDNGAKPVGVVFPFSSIIRKNYDAELLTSFRNLIHRFEESHNFTCIDLFDMDLDYDCFIDLTHLNAKGASLASSVLALKLWQNDLIPTESFCEMSPEYFQTLSTIAPADEYNALMEQIAKVSDKISKPL